MIQFLIKRFIGLIFVVLGVTFITFMMGYKAPGDPIRFMLGVHFSQTQYIALRHYYRLDLPWYQQYFNYLKNLFTLNFGLSYEFRGRAVVDILKDGIPISLELGLWALFLQVVTCFSLPLIIAAPATR